MKLRLQPLSRLRRRSIPSLLALLALLSACSTDSTDGSRGTQRDLASQGEGANASVMLPKGEPREIDFTTEEGTWMSVDVSPDGSWLVFDLLGHIYRLPVDGGTAECLTQGSGIALNFHPAISPDGTQIAFISDRSGQNNVWVMEQDGEKPRPVLLDPETRFTDPEWSPDGSSIAAVRILPTPGRGWHRRTMELWRLPLDGSAASAVKRARGAHFTAPSFAPDGRHLYYQVAYSTWFGKGMLKAGHRIQRLELVTQTADNPRLTAPPEPTAEYQDALDRTLWAEDVEGDPPATLAPEISPDGRSMAFAQEVPGAAFEFRGHEYQPRTALLVRDLGTGAERTLLDPAPKDLTRVNAQYSYRVFPGYSWSPDSRSLFLAHGGKLLRIDADTGSAEVVPFEARVRRTISEQVRGRVEIDDETVQVRFLQWPSADPPGEQLLFVAAGRIWSKQLAGRDAARALTESMLPHYQLAPAWSPDGSQVAFASWHDVEGGNLWVVGRDGGGARKINAEPGAFHYPTWSADGGTLYAAHHALTTTGGRMLAQANVWDRPDGWSLVALDPSGGDVRLVTELGAATRPHLTQGGRIAYSHQQNPLAAAELYQPFPPESALEQTVRLVSVRPDGDDRRTHAILPATMGRIRGLGSRHQPLLSPDGRYVAWQTDQLVQVQRLPESDGPSPIVTDPNRRIVGRSTASELGGAYHRWRDATTLEMASGFRYVTYDVESGQRTVHDLAFRLPRPQPSGTLALEGARIVTIDGDRVIEAGTIRIDGSRIACLGDCDTTDADRVVDVSGSTIIPGLIDLHAHHTAEVSGVISQHRPASALALAYGVTTVVDPAGEPFSSYALGEMIAAGALVGPRTFTSGSIVITRAHAWGDRLEITERTPAEYQIDRRVDRGAITIKNYRQGRRQQHQLIIEAARRSNVSVTSEGGPLYFDVGLVMDGQTGWEHLIAHLPLYSDATTFFGLAEAHYSPTAIVAGHVDGSMEYFRPRQGLQEDPKYTRFMPELQLRALHASMRDLRKSELSFPIIAEGLADIVRSGGYGAIGEHGNQPGMGEHWELWSYAEALTPLEALRVATLHGAHFVGLEEELGSIEVGKLADLVVLRSNPLDDIRSSSDIAYVVKGGVLYEADTLEQIWPVREPYGPVPWHADWPR